MTNVLPAVAEEAWAQTGIERDETENKVSESEEQLTARAHPSSPCV